MTLPRAIFKSIRTYTWPLASLPPLPLSIIVTIETVLCVLMSVALHGDPACSLCCILI